MNQTDSIRVVVADDQAIVRDGLVTVLDLLPDVTVVAQAADGEEACRLVEEHAPDVVLMDLRMPVLDGAAATARIGQQNPAVAVLVLTTFADDASIMGALRAGARGYLTKDAGRDEIGAALRAVVRGQTTLAAEVGARLISGLGDTDAGAGEGSVPGPAVSEPAVPGRAAPEPVARRDEVAKGPSPREGRAEVHPWREPDPGELHRRFPFLTPRECDVLSLIADGLSNSEIAARLFVSVSTVKTHINAIFSKLAVRDRAQAITLVLGD